MSIAYTVGNKVVLSDRREGIIIWKGLAKDSSKYGLVITKGDGLFEREPVLLWILNRKNKEKSDLNCVNHAGKHCLHVGNP